MNLKKLYTAEEVAEAFQLDSTNFLDEAARQKLIPHTRIGRKLRFTETQVNQAITILEVPAATAMPPAQAQHRQSAVAPEPDTDNHRLSALVRTRLDQAKP